MDKKFYAVKRGRKPGIYETWKEAEEQIKGFPNAYHRSFKNYDDAEKFFNSEDNLNIDEVKKKLDSYFKEIETLKNKNKFSEIFEKFHTLILEKYLVVELFKLKNKKELKKIISEKLELKEDSELIQFIDEIICLITKSRNYFYKSLNPKNKKNKNNFPLYKQFEDLSFFNRKNLSILLENIFKQIIIYLINTYEKKFFI